jgi:thiamine biosynthesis protein ThiS
MKIDGTHLKPYSLATSEWPLWIRFFHLLMKLKLNGEDKEISDGLSVAGLLEQLQIRPARVVVERNREIVPRDAYDAILLAEGDTLEIVHFVGGG